MASNFKIFVHQNSENLHLKLMGDFDGSSAYQLLNIIKDNGHHVHKIFIHTNGLKDINPFGKAVFVNHLSSQHDGSTDIVFTGSNCNAFL